MRNRKKELLVSVSGTGSILKCNIELPIKNERVVRNKIASVSPEYKSISENIAKKVQQFRELQRKLVRSEIALRKNSSVVIANSLNKIILNSHD